MFFTIALHPLTSPAIAMAGGNFFGGRFIFLFMFLFFFEDFDSVAVGICYVEDAVALRIFFKGNAFGAVEEDG